MAKGLFYWYFETKESLFAELVRTMRHELRRAQAAAMDPAADPLTRIRQGSAASVRFMAEHQSYFALLDVERRDDTVVRSVARGQRRVRRRRRAPRDRGARPKVWSTPAIRACTRSG